MRLLNRLHQYQRLWQPSSGAPQQVTVAELAGRCFCSERHVRTLLRQAQEAGWLTWRAQSGRGKRGSLCFLVTPASLRNQMMEQALNKGQQQNVLELAQLAPEDLRALLSPVLGGRWQNNTPTLRIPYYRQFKPLCPGFQPGRAEQHMVGQVFCGLTRFVHEQSQPEGDLAHHWDVSTDGLRWRFYIRSPLYWHNGDALTTEQLRQRFDLLLTLPSLRTLFASVSKIEATHAHCLTFTLNRPDYWLAHRLASYCSVLAHPDDTQIGCGPFRLAQFDAELVRLESHDRYHLGHPLLQAVEYWITPQLFGQDLGTSCRHPVQVAIGQPEELSQLRMVSSSISLGFCWLAMRKSAHLTQGQARRIVQIIHQTPLLHQLPLDEDLITPSDALLPGWTLPRWPDNDDLALPEKLTLLYHLPIELHTMAQQLKLALSTLGSELTIIFHDGKSWDGCDRLPDADILMGDRLIGEAPEYALEQWLRCDSLWANLLNRSQFAHMQTTLDTVQAQSDATIRSAALKAVLTRLMDDATLTPLFNYHYQVSAPPGVNGIRLNTLGWFDFSQAWLPTPES